MQSLLSRGVLISVEGIDGSGKSTLVNNLTTALQQNKFLAIRTQEPGGTQLGKQLRKILQEKTMPVHHKAEYLLFASDRAQHFHEIVIPALKQNKIVISDRMADSSLVYQGYGRGLDLGMLRTINSWCMNGFTPDITLYVHITPEQAWQRLLQRNEKLSSFEKEKKEFTAMLAHGFKELFAGRDNIITLDGMQTPEALTNQAVQEVTQWLTDNNILTP